MKTYCTICGKRAHFTVNNSRAYCETCLNARLATLSECDAIIMPITEAGPMSHYCDSFGCANVATHRSPTTRNHWCNYHAHLLGYTKENKE